MKRTRQPLLHLAGALASLGLVTSQALAGGVAGDNKITSDKLCEYSLDTTHTWGGTNNCFPGTGNPPLGTITFRQGTSDDTATISYGRNANAPTSAYGTVFCGGNLTYPIVIPPGSHADGNCGAVGSNVIATVCGPNPQCQGHAAQ